MQGMLRFALVPLDHGLQDGFLNSRRAQTFEFIFFATLEASSLCPLCCGRCYPSHAASGTIYREVFATRSMKGQTFHSEKDLISHEDPNQPTNIIKYHETRVLASQTSLASFTWRLITWPEFIPWPCGSACIRRVKADSMRRKKASGLDVTCSLVRSLGVYQSEEGVCACFLDLCDI